MLLKIFSIHDAKAEYFNTPFFNKTHGEAERNFKKAVNEPKTILNQNPEDFDLYYIGEYDDQSGQIKPLKTPIHVCKAIHHLPKISQELRESIKTTETKISELNTPS